MRIVKVLTDYYQQFDADYSIPIPGEGYGGWKKAELEIDIDRTAIVVMHAWDYGNELKYPGWYRVAEYIPRARSICKQVFPTLLAAVRNSGMKVFHVVHEGKYYKDLPGYKKAVRLTGKYCSSLCKIDSGPALKKLKRFRMKESFYGLHNKNDVEQAFEELDFSPYAKPIDEEGIAENADQLFSLCKNDGINHLVYAGFAVNWCIQSSPGGMVDMERKGFMCSVIRDAVTAVENKETAGDELCKETALWRIALGFGFVYDLKDFISAISRHHCNCK